MMIVVLMIVPFCTVWFCITVVGGKVKMSLICTIWDRQKIIPHLLSFCNQNSTKNMTKSQRYFCTQLLEGYKCIFNSCYILIWTLFLPIRENQIPDKTTKPTLSLHLPILFYSSISEEHVRFCLLKRHLDFAFSCRRVWFDIDR